VLTSSKTGIGIKEVLEAIVTRPAAPVGDATAPCRRCCGSWYDIYLGVVILCASNTGHPQGHPDPIHVHGQCLQRGARRRIHTQALEVAALNPGELGFLTASIKAVADTSVGDTVTKKAGPRRTAARFKPSVPCVVRPVPDRRRQFESCAKASPNCG